jgi:hypothetical protein
VDGYSSWEVEVLIIIRTLEVFGGQFYHFGDNLKGSYSPLCYVASCNVVFTFLAHHTTFEVVINKTKSHLGWRNMGNNSY